MAAFRKKPVVIEASRWFGVGDHPLVTRYPAPNTTNCAECGRPLYEHGWIITLEDHARVCPGDWVITGVRGEHYPCKPDVFAATYDPITPNQ